MEKQTTVRYVSGPRPLQRNEASPGTPKQFTGRSVMPSPIVRKIDNNNHSSSNSAHSQRRRFSGNAHATENTSGSVSNPSSEDGHDEEGPETKFIIRLLKQIQRNMSHFQGRLDGFNRKIIELEKVQHNFINSQPASSAANSLPSKQIMRLDRRINVLTQQMNYMKGDLLDRINDITVQVGCESQQQPRKKPKVTLAGNQPIDEHYDNENEDYGPPVLERGAPLDEQEPDTSSEFEDDEPSGVVTDPTHLTEYSQNEEANNMDQESMEQSQEDDQGQMEDGNHFQGGEEHQDQGSGEDIVWSTFVDEVGNTVEFSIMKSTGKHKCPYPTCAIECVSRGSLVRHYNNFHSVSTTFKCSLCGSTYTRKDNLLKHLKIKHNYVAEPQTIDSKLKKLLDQKNSPEGYENDNDDENHESSMVVEPEIMLDEGEGDNEGDGTGDYLESNEDADESIEEQDPQNQRIEFGTFVNKGKVIRYQITMSGQHLCPIGACGSEFPTRKDLLRHFHNPTSHLNLPSPPRSFDCSVCGVIYRRRDDLTRHLWHKHQIYRPPVRQPKYKNADEIQPYNYSESSEEQLIQPEVLLNEGEGDMQNYMDDNTEQYEDTEGEIFEEDSQDGNGNVEGEFASFLDNTGNNVAYNIINGKHVCPIMDCGIEYSSKGSLMRHYLKPHTHSGNTPAPATLPHQCTMCDMSFRRPEDLTKHIRKQHIPGQVDFNEYDGHQGGVFQEDGADGEASATYFTCKICSNTYTEEEDLTEHISTSHPHHLPGTSTSSRSATAINVSSDSPEASFPPVGDNEKQCPICLRTFTRKEHVKRHMVLHANEKFACSGCDKMYSRQDILRAHQRQVHGRVLDNVFKVKIENNNSLGQV